MFLQEHPTWGISGRGLSDLNLLRESTTTKKAKVDPAGGPWGLILPPSEGPENLMFGLNQAWFPRA